MSQSFDALEIATRAALLLGATAAVVVRDATVVGVVGLSEQDTAEVQHWLDTDPHSAVAWEGGIRRLARARWPGDEADEVWILGDTVRRLPESAYATLSEFMEQVRDDWLDANYPLQKAS